MGENEQKLKRLDDCENTVAQLAESIDQMGRESSSLDAQIAAKRSELAQLTANVERAKTSPIQYAGSHIVGRHVRPGRYTVKGSRNFFVKDPSGGLRINVILGDGGLGVGPYVCNLNANEEIDARSALTLYPWR